MIAYHEAAEERDAGDAGTRADGGAGSVLRRGHGERSVHSLSEAHQSVGKAPLTGGAVRPRMADNDARGLITPGAGSDVEGEQDRESNTNAFLKYYRTVLADKGWGPECERWLSEPLPLTTRANIAYGANFLLPMNTRFTFTTSSARASAPEPDPEPRPTRRPLDLYLQKITGELCQQETASMAPVRALFGGGGGDAAVDLTLPDRGLTVEAEKTPPLRCLDLCAAPGSKSCQLLDVVAARINGSCARDFLVVANDVDPERAEQLWLRASQLHPELTKHLVVTHADAAVADFGRGGFDCVLCDVPCSGDGTVRKNPRKLDSWTPKNAIANQPLQKKILRNGLMHLAAGGRLVYSTCSLNPVENDAVVEETLAELKLEWGTQEPCFPFRLEGPHERTLPGRDHGGFFVAVIVRDEIVCPAAACFRGAEGSTTCFRQLGLGEGRGAIVSAISPAVQEFLRSLDTNRTPLITAVGCGAAVLYKQNPAKTAFEDLAVSADLHTFFPTKTIPISSPHCDDSNARIGESGRKVIDFDGFLFCQEGAVLTLRSLFDKSLGASQDNLPEDEPAREQAIEAGNIVRNCVFAVTREEFLRAFEERGIGELWLCAAGTLNMPELARSGRQSDTGPLSVLLCLDSDMVLTGSLCCKSERIYVRARPQLILRAVEMLRERKMAVMEDSCGNVETAGVPITAV
eukprot:g3907.t1